VWCWLRNFYRDLSAYTANGVTLCCSLIVHLFSFAVFLCIKQSINYKTCSGLDIPLQIGDPMVAPHGEYVWNKYRHPGFAIAYTVAKEDVRKWIAGKRYIPQQKSPRKYKSMGCPRGDGNSVGVAEPFSWPVGWAQTGYPKVP